jgi:hypothetical protein
MKRTMGIVAVAVMALVGTNAFAKAGKTAWSAQGKYYETCGCKVSCPCGTGEFLPTEPHCDAIMIFHFDKAAYGKTKLDGLNVAAVLRSPKSQKVLEAFMKGEMDHFAVYLDDKATDEQKAAIGPFLDALLGKMEIKGAKAPAFVPIKLDVNGDEAKFDINNGKLTGDIVNLALPGETKEGKKSPVKRYKIEGAAPFPFMPSVTQGKSKTFHYADGPVKWDYTDRNAFFSEFNTKGQAEAAAAPKK